MFFEFEFVCGTPPSCLKVMAGGGWWWVVVGGGWWWVVVGGLQHFSVSPRPLGFWFWVWGAKGLGPGLDNIRIQLSSSGQGLVRSSSKAHSPGPRLYTLHLVWYPTPSHHPTTQLFFLGSKWLQTLTTGSLKVQK